MNLKKIFRAILVCVFLFVGITPVLSQNVASSENYLADLGELVGRKSYGKTKKGYGTMNGAGKIYMVLNIDNGGNVSGRYYYVKNKKGNNVSWISLSGYLLDNGTMHLSEYVSGSETGFFEAYYFQGKVMKGTFTRYKDGRKFSYRVNF